MQTETPTLNIDGKVATITLNRPEKANRLSPDDLVAMCEHIAAVNGMTDVQVLRLESRGKYFCSGYDISKLGGERKVEFEDFANLLETARPITVAIIHGSVYGGGTDMSLACDFRVGAKGINMFMPAARLGLHFYRGGMERYVTRLGLNAAKRLFLTAEQIDAEEMYAIGFLTHLVTPEALQDTADSLVNQIASMAPLAVLGMKKHLNAIARHELDLSALQQDIDKARHSDDIKEGRAAWMEKRTPRFLGR